jgi:phthalate 4,5-dioxygenase
MERTERGIYKRVEDGWWNLESEEQDRAAQESQGLIHDRTREFIATSDGGVVKWRKMAFESIEAVRQGRDPTGVVRDAAQNKLITFDAGKNFTDHERALGEVR